MGQPFTFVLVMCVCGSLWAGGLSVEQQLTSGTASGAEPSVVVGPGDNVLMAFVENGEVRVQFGAGSTSVSPGAGQSAPAVHLASNGLVSVVYEQVDTTPGAIGPEVFVAQALVGGFGPAINLSLSLDSDVRPLVVGGVAGDSLNVVWVREGTGEVLLSEDLSSGVAIATGDEIDLFATVDGERHFVYVRDGDVFYRADTGGNIGPEVEVAIGQSAAQPSLSVDASGTVHVVFVVGNDVVYTRRVGSDPFQATTNLTQSVTPTANPQVLAGQTGLKVIFERDGDLWEVIGAGTIFLSPENLTDTPGVESSGDFAIDSLGNLHLVYVRDGEVYYRNAVPPPVAQFSFTPNSGEIPLEVQFTDESEGVVDQWQWSFGDGGTSIEQNPVHVYETTGSYEVTLTTTGPSGVSSTSVSDAVQVIDPVNFMRLQPVKVFQNQTGVRIPILGTHVDPIQGLQIAVEWDCGVIDVETVSIEDTIVATIDPEFVVAQIVPAECYAIVGVVIDILAPFDGRTLDPNDNRRIAEIICDVPGSAPVGVSEVRLVNGLSDPPIINIYTVNGVSVLPTLESATIEVVPFSFPPPTVFLRGDVDNNGANEITDAINLLGFLFSGGATPVCQDAADANDTGDIDVADVIYVLNFLFAQGAVPPPPFPNLGLDPTPDPLDEC